MMFYLMSGVTLNLSDSRPQLHLQTVHLMHVPRVNGAVVIYGAIYFYTVANRKKVYESHLYNY